jgi:hypothetical protein
LAQIAGTGEWQDQTEANSINKGKKATGSIKIQ